MEKAMEWQRNNPEKFNNGRAEKAKQWSKNWRERNHEKSCEIGSAWRIKNKDKANVHLLVFRHPEKINITHECLCSDSNKEYHHADYSKPFDVMKMCRPCHKAEHKRLRLLADQSANDSSNPEALSPNILERPADMTAIAATR